VGSSRFIGALVGLSVNLDKGPLSPTQGSLVCAFPHSACHHVASVVVQEDYFNQIARKLKTLKERNPTPGGAPTQPGGQASGAGGFLRNLLLIRVWFDSKLKDLRCALTARRPLTCT